MSLQEELEKEYREIQRAMARKTRSMGRPDNPNEPDDHPINPALCESPTSPGPGLSSPSGSVSSRRTRDSSSGKSGSSPMSSASSLNEQSTSPATSITSLPFSSTCPSPCVAFASRRSVELIRFFFNDYSPRIVFTGLASDNDWRQLLLPLSFTNETFRNAICAFVSAHLEAMDIITGKGSLDFHRAALFGLSSQVHSDLSDATCSLATILLLIKYEALVGEDVSSILSHLHAANNLLGLFPDIEDPTMSFLRRTFRSYDIMIALSQGCSAVADSRPMSQPPSSPLQSPHPRPESPPDIIDQVYGVSADLWSILHRLCDLRPLLEELAAASSPEMMQDGNHLKAAVLRGELESLCAATEKALAAWQPAPFSNRALHHHALAYRDSALVHLYRAVYLLPSSHPAVRQRCRSSLEHCVAAAAHPGARALLWPLFVAACSAEGGGGDRSFARSAFEFIGKKQEMASTKRAWLVVTRAWAMMDGGGGGGHSPNLALDVFPMTRNFGNMMSNAVMLW
ncbi:unnamed protein product [Clonostachys solani]|uniref:Uncharacterized protein n=1 Tax=Clonostachys solani TaxID=160281 RepID=A0A9N9VYA7_9HYPO|nr:unnamed protein product [Clonostachys solani]